MKVPVDEIFAVVDRDAGEVFERGGRQKEVILADADDGGVWVEAGDDGVAIRHLRDVVLTQGRWHNEGTLTDDLPAMVKGRP